MVLGIIWLVFCMKLHVEAQSDCSILAKSKGYPVASVCSQSQLSQQPIFVMDFYGAQSITDKSCECTLTSTASYTMTITQFSNIGINYVTSNHCGVKVFFTTSNSGNESIHCSPTASLSVSANDPLKISLVKELSTYDARFCMEMRSSNAMTVNCKAPAIVQSTTKPTAPSTTSTTTQQTTKQEQTAKQLQTTESTTPEQTTKQQQTTKTTTPVQTTTQIQTTGATMLEQTTKQQQTTKTTMPVQTTKEEQTTGATMLDQTTKQEQTTKSVTPAQSTKQEQMTTEATVPEQTQATTQMESKSSTQGQTMAQTTTMPKKEDTTSAPIVSEPTKMPITSESPTESPTEQKSSTIGVMPTTAADMSTDMPMSSMSPTSGDTQTSVPAMSSKATMSMVTTTEREETEEGSPDTLTYIIPAVVGGAVLLLFIVGVLQCACRSRNKEKKQTRFAPRSNSEDRFFAADMTGEEMTEEVHEEYEDEKNTMYNPVFVNDNEEDTVIQQMPDGSDEKVTRFSTASSEWSEDSSNPNSESYLYATVQKHKKENGVDPSDEGDVDVIIENGIDNDEMEVVRF